MGSLRVAESTIVENYLLFYPILTHCYYICIDDVYGCGHSTQRRKENFTKVIIWGLLYGNASIYTAWNIVNPPVSESKSVLYRPTVLYRSFEAYMVTVVNWVWCESPSVWELSMKILGFVFSSQNLCQSNMFSLCLNNEWVEFVICRYAISN